ncbi:MAG TPA: HetP family heterocyst commitment protein [Crinalium sp.]
MHFNNSKSEYRDRNTGRVMTVDEFNQVIEAIATGRYSWACVLILRIAGYNPLHYLPYRTYRRLVKENSQNSVSSQSVSDKPKDETELDLHPAQQPQQDDLKLKQEWLMRQ